MKKRIITMFFALIMLFSFLPARTFAEVNKSAVVEVAEDSENISESEEHTPSSPILSVVASDDFWTFYDNGTLVISGEMGDYSRDISAPWYDNRSAIKSIEIKSGVTSIGDWAFSDCDSLTDVTIPDTVSRIGNFAFFYCNNMSSIMIPDSVTIIGNNAFFGTALQYVRIPESVMFFGNAVFGGCSSLVNIFVDGGNKYFHGANNCIIEKSTDTLIAGCKTSIIPDDGSVRKIGDGAFAGCSSLTNITIPSTVWSIGDSAFCVCDSLTTVVISNRVTSIGESAFFGCDAIHNIYYSGNKEQWDQISISSGNDALFAQEVIHFDYETLIAAGDCCDNLAWTLNSKGTLTVFGTGDLEGFSPWHSYYNRIQSVIIMNGVTSIGEYVFEGIGLTSITIPDSVTSIGDMAFSGCSSLKSITIPDSVTSIGDMAFSQCYDLTSITIPDSVTSIGNGAFELCGSLESIEIGSGLTTFGHSTFIGNLKSITVDKRNKTFHSANNCLIETASKTLILGCSTSVIPDDGSVTSIGDAAFYFCRGMTEIIVPDSITTIGYMFCGYCGALTKVSLGSGVSSLGDAPLLGCDVLESIEVDPDNSFFCSKDGVLYDKSVSTLIRYPSGSSGSFAVPNGVTTIEEHAFDGSKLFEIIVPTSVTYIADRAMNGFTHRVLIYYLGTEKQWARIMLGENAIPDNSFLVFNTPYLSVSDAVVYSSEELRIPISINRNTGVAALNFKIEYDHRMLELVDYEDGLVDEWLVGVGEGEKAVWVNTSDFTGNGTLLTLVFRILENNISFSTIYYSDGRAGIPKSDTIVTLSDVFAADLSENEINIPARSGEVTIIKRLSGDVNGDGSVNAIDLLRLKKNLAKLGVAIVETNSDVTGDGIVDASDLLRLKKYLAGINVTLE